MRGHTIENGRLLPHPAAEHIMIANFDTLVSHAIGTA